MKPKINLIIPAAGEATRLRPLSNNTSKIMVRVNGKPCLDYILEQAYKLADVQSTIIVRGQFNDIEEYCSIKYPEVYVIQQHELKGPHDAIRLAVDHLNVSTKHDETLPVVIWLGDAIILDDTLELGSDFLLTKHVDDHSNWCMWDQHDRFYNKPSQHIDNAVALVGLYSFKNGLDAIDSFQDTAGSYDISSGLESYIGKGNTLKNVLTDKWYDIGSIQTYHETCNTLLNMKSRVFNNIEYDHDLGVLIKSPDYHNKDSIDTLQAEIQWYKNLGLEQKCFVPHIIDQDNDQSLMMSFESGTLLSDMMLYDNINESTWEYILNKLFQIKIKYFSKPSTNTDFNEEFDQLSTNIWIHKTHDRIYHDSCQFNDAQLRKISDLAHRVQQQTKPIKYMHGDLHLGNVLYNYQTDKLSLLDPRGNYGGHIGCYGDDLYDWCKLAHDLHYGYNAIVANTKPNEIVKKIFIRLLRKYNLPVDVILDGGLVLLASCIPLHYDDHDRQQRMNEKVKYELDY